MTNLGTFARTQRSSGDSVATPEHILAAVRTEFGEFFDPCPLNSSFDPKVHTDGLKIPWGPVNFINPPWSRAGMWLKKAYAEWKLGKTCVVLLKCNITATKNFRNYSRGAELRFLPRTQFPGYTTAFWGSLMLLVFRAGNASTTWSSI